jgi:hypothetical protein
MLGIQAIPKEPGPSSQLAAVPPSIETEPPTEPAPIEPASEAALGRAALGRAATGQPGPAKAVARPAPGSIEIDPSLLEPTDAQPVIDPALADTISPEAMRPVPSPLAAVPPVASAPGVWPSPTLPARVDLTDAGTGFFQDTGAQPRIGYVTDSSSGFFQDTGAQERVGYQSEDMTALVQASSPRQKRVLVIVVTCTAVLALAFVALAVMGNDRSEGTQTTAAKPVRGAATAVVPAPGSGSAAPAPAVGAGDGSAAMTDGGDGDGSAAPAGDGSGGGVTERPTTDVAAISPPVEGDCSAKVSSSPAGAEVFIAGKPRGKTPVTLSLPCSPQQLTVRMNRYQSYNKRIKPTARGIKVSARLKRPTFTVKISSVPSGATISIGGKRAGRTPSAVKIPGYESTMITLTKDGYVTATEKVTAKQNGTAIKMTLRRR